MRSLLKLIPLWTYLLVVFAAVPVATVAGGGAVSASSALALTGIAVCAAALSGRRTTAVATMLAAAAAVGSLGWSLPGWNLVSSTVAAASLVVVGGMILSVVEHLDGCVEKMREQASRWVRKLYEQEKCRQPGPHTHTARPHAPHDGDGLAGSHVLSQGDVINFAMLLLTLQDVAQRISANLHLETLVPTIVDIARASLKCRTCDLYLWDPATRTLRPAATGKRDDCTGYVPDPERGAARWVIEHGHILTRHSVETDYTLCPLLKEDPDMPDAIAPLTVGGELVGLLVVDGVEDKSITFVRMLYILSHNCALGIKNAQLFKRIEAMARHDGLTGLLNHASFQEELSELARRSGERNEPLAVIMSDVDHFKKFNDTYGHQAGDEVLRSVARLWKALAPERAVLGRYGGEEFIIALPGYDTLAASELAEQLREELERLPVVFQGQVLQVTASFGVAERREGAETADDLVRDADGALYEAKRLGRNRVVVFDPSGSSAEVTSSSTGQPID